MVDAVKEQPAHRPEGSESPVWIVALLGSLVVLAVIGVIMNPGSANEVKRATNFEAWRVLLGVVATLAIFSILYKENPIFRFMEHIFIGLATGIGIVIMWFQMIYPRWYVPMAPASAVPGGQGHWWLILLLLLGLLFYTVYFPKLSWMNRFGFGVLMGWVAGLAFRSLMSTLGPQIMRSFKAPFTTYSMGEAGFNNFFFAGVWWHPVSIIFIVVLFCTLAYFFFSVEHRARWIRQPANAGRYFIMVTLGAIFGTTVMGRFSLLIERLDFLLRSFGQWFHAIIK